MMIFVAEEGTSSKANADAHREARVDRLPVKLARESRLPQRYRTLVPRPQDPHSRSGYGISKRSRTMQATLDIDRPHKHRSNLDGVSRGRPRVAVRELECGRRIQS